MGMNKSTRTAVYISAGAVMGVCAFGFFREHALLAHQTAGASRSRMLAFLSLLLFSAITLCVFLLYRLPGFVRRRAEGWMVQSGQPTGPVPELEEAERVRTAGDPLDAIRLMREYLLTHPYELHVMGRIAEIYRYDLGNDLAAALEYEELLKHKLPDEQWAWAAVHLAKLYARLNELDKSVSLLEQIDGQYSHTVAGKRAKKALEQARNPQGEPGAIEEDNA
jgi:hypothetical protein